MHFRVLSYFQKDSATQLNRKIIGICKGKKSAKKVLKDLDELNWIDRVGYGRFKLTDKGAEIISGAVSCEDCGANFGSINQANSSGNMRCAHENLSYNITEFSEDSFR